MPRGSPFEDKQRMGQGRICAALPVPASYHRFAPGPGAAIAETVDAA